MQYSPNFTEQMLTRSATATKLGIDNTPDDAARAALKALCENVLEKVIKLTGKSIVINSGYRSPALNAAVRGASKTSQHSLGEAADIECPGMSNLLLAQTIAHSEIEYDQLILEFYTPGDPSSGWVHVSHKATSVNRRQLLTAARINGKTTYSAGING